MSQSAISSFLLYDSPFASHKKNSDRTLDIILPKHHYFKKFIGGYG